MQSFNSNEIKKIFKQYSFNKGYKFYNTDSIIARPDTNLYFNIAGAVNFQEQLLNNEKTSIKKAASLQDCIRLNDLDKTGSSGRHHLSFEMLNAFNFYSNKEPETKEEFIIFMYDFIINKLDLDPKRIQVTAHPQDQVTQSIWGKLGINNIIKQDKNVFCYRNSKTNKSALRTEILWQRDKLNSNSFAELFNLAFIQFNSDKVFNNPMEYISAASGGCLDRLVTAVEDKTNDYENSMWYGFIKNIMTENTLDEIIARKIADFTNVVFKLYEANLEPNKESPQNHRFRRCLRTLIDLCTESNISFQNIYDTYNYNNNYLSNDPGILNLYENEKKRYNIHTLRNKTRVEKEVLKQGTSHINESYLEELGLPNYEINQILDTINK